MTQPLKNPVNVRLYPDQPGCWIVRDGDQVLGHVWQVLDGLNRPTNSWGYNHPNENGVPDHFNWRAGHDKISAAKALIRHLGYDVSNVRKAA